VFGIEHQQTKPAATLSGFWLNYPRLPFEQDFLNFTEAITTAQPEINSQGETHGSKTDDQEPTRGSHC
jgi:hypothetical protein